MTIQGAITELQNLLKVDDIPFYHKVAMKKVIETIQGEKIEATDSNGFVTVSKEHLINLEQKAKDSEYYRGRVEGLEYVIDALDSIFKSMERSINND